MRRFNSSHVAAALAILLCITAYSVSLLLHPAHAQASEEEPVTHILRGVETDEDELRASVEEHERWRNACTPEDISAVHDYFHPPANQIIVTSCNAAARPPLNLAAPQYPKLAQAARISGKVVVQVLIDETGRVIYSDALTGHPVLAPAALKAACQVRFKPFTLGGIPVKTSGTLTYNFVLE